MATGLAPRCKVCGTPLSGLRSIPPRVLRGVRRNPKNPNYCNVCSVKMIKGEIAEIPVLFADVRGFTGLTTALGPMRVKELLDRYFHTVSEILFARDAIVDHFIGDAVLAFFTRRWPGPTPARPAARWNSRASGSRSAPMRSPARGDEGSIRPLGLRSSAPGT